MGLFKRGNVWWYKFLFNGQLVRESSKSRSKTVSKESERTRRREMEERFNGIGKRQRAQIFSVIAGAWLEAQAAHLSPRSVLIERTNLKHLNPVFGKTLLCDITADDIARYQAERLKKAGAAPKTVNLEVGTLRAILRKNRIWANLQPDVKMLRNRDDAGRAITADEEKRLLEACLASRSRSLYRAVVVALSTCMRYSEIRLLKWGQLDFARHTVTVGWSKTEAGDGRVIPLNERAYKVLSMWASNFPDRAPEHYLFPTERYGAAGDVFTPCTYDTDPTKPIGNWKEAWEAAKRRAKVQCRFHDLRHTGCTRMLEAGVPFSVVATIMGWSATATVRMVKRYGHIGQAAQREAVAALNGVDFETGGAQNWAQSQRSSETGLAN